MRFVMFVRPAGQRASAPWREEYNLKSVHSIEDAAASAQALIMDWNARGQAKTNRRGRGGRGLAETKREVVAVECGGFRKDLL